MCCTISWPVTVWSLYAKLTGCSCSFGRGISQFLKIANYSFNVNPSEPQHSALIAGVTDREYFPLKKWSSLRIIHKNGDTVSRRRAPQAIFH